MKDHYLHLPIETVRIDAQRQTGPLEAWRHALGHGGINPLPLPPGVVRGIKKLKPRLIRIFIQEHFHIYPEHGRFDWSLLDDYMAALAETGAQVVAAITIKPPVLFPIIDDSIWRPNHVAEWQQVIYALVQRYSVEKPIVTYWEVGNETDIGENGGSPYLIPDPRDYFEYYQMTIEPVLRAFPQARVGGPAACWITNEPLPGLVRLCRETGTRLDFISWHCYNSDPSWHAHGVALAKELLSDWPGPRPEMLYTEWNKFFEIIPGVLEKHGRRQGQNVSVEEMAFEPQRAALVAASILRMMDAGMDWTFYYHIWDQVFYPSSFRSFFSEAGIRMMLEHWNEVPHRMGLFGVNGEVRPTYFAYQMLGQMQGQRLETAQASSDLAVLAARGKGSIAVLCASYHPVHGQEVILQLDFSGLEPGLRRITVYRIDSERHWDAEQLELLPVECREVYTLETFTCQVSLPADSVVLVRLDDTEMPLALAGEEGSR